MTGPLAVASTAACGWAGLPAAVARWSVALSSLLRGRPPNTQAALSRVDCGGIGTAHRHTLVANNNCLARTNKSDTRAEVTLPEFHRLWPSRADAEHELAPSRPVFFPLPAYGPRGVTRYHLRNFQPQAETAGNPDEGHAAAGRAQREWPLVKANDRGRRSCAAVPEKGHAARRVPPARSFGADEAKKPLPTQVHTRTKP